MTLQKKFVAAAKLLGGEVPRWQGGAATKLGITRSHMHHITTGFRSVTQVVLIKLVTAIRAEVVVLRDRADRMEAALEGITVQEMTAASPMTDEEYERQADESVDAINELAFGAIKGDDE